MNLYVHFPVCRAKCVYCALHSRAGIAQEAKAVYVKSLLARLEGITTKLEEGLETIYFGGGSPALLDLDSICAAIRPYCKSNYEWTVELHPRDVTKERLETLERSGVNRVSMGVESLNEATLAAMGRNYTAQDAARAFSLVREHFDNAGIDIILGFPGDNLDWTERHSALAEWGLKHLSLYTIILEEKSALGSLVRQGKVKMPCDDALMDALAVFRGRIESELGLRQYEISSYAKPGYECRHNLAVWLGEDYLGVGEGAYGRTGLKRYYTPPAKPFGELAPCEVESVTQDEDAKERTLFALRTRYGLDAARFPQWREALERFCAHGVLKGDWPHYVLTARGLEICDAILEELV